MNVFKIAAVGAMAASVVSGCAQFASGRNAPEPLAEKVLAPYVEKGILPGAISVFVDGDRSEVVCAGYADPETKRPVTLDSPYMQCSQTKGFCGVTVAILVEACEGGFLAAGAGCVSRYPGYSVLHCASGPGSVPRVVPVFMRHVSGDVETELQR